MSFLRLFTFSTVIILFTSYSNAQYCASGATSTADSKCAQVVLNGDTQNINNNTTANGCEQYSNHTGLTPADLTQGSGYTVSITNGSCGGTTYGRYANAWIDWNQDGDFADANEMLGTGSSYSTTNGFVHNIAFTVPVAALTGNTRMRVILKESGVATDPCASFTWGETEDYTVTILSSGPMSYVSSTTTQANTAAVQNCEGAAEILGMEVITTGSSSPITLTQFNLTTAGTTNLGDLTAVNVYYTGSSNAFATGSLFGTVAPGGAVAITGSQVLASGSNYFWVEYTLNPPMTNGNILDGTCTGLTVGGTGYVPSVTSPAGSRSIGACNPSPGGVSGNLQTWFDANNGTVGSPVVTWNNLGPNANITALTSPNGGNLIVGFKRANYNNIVNTTGAYNGTFHAEVPTRTQVIAGNGVTMYTAYQRKAYPDLSFNFHGSIQTNSASNSAAQWLTWGFRHGGLGSLFSDGATHLYHAATQAQMSENSGFVGMHGTSSSTGGNSMNGSEMSFNIGSFHAGGNFMELSIGYWPGYGMSRGVMEAVLWDKDLSSLERDKVETYLAIKYGITLGLNGTSLDYISPSDGSVVWDVSANLGFNYDIAGISRSDVSGLDQRKSHSTNGPSINIYNDILTIANGANYFAPTVFTNDGEFLTWGHDNDPTINTGVMVMYPTDNGEVIETIFQREWKSQETGAIGIVSMEFDLSTVIGVGGVVGANDLSYVRLLVDEDGDYSNGATSIAPSGYNNVTGIVYFRHDFVAPTGNHLDQLKGYFFTLGSTSIANAPLPVELIYYEVENQECSNLITWTTASEINSDYYVIDRSFEMGEWEFVGKVHAAGNSSQELDYMYRDNSFSENGVVYYRLSQVDFDGKVNEIGIYQVSSFCADNLDPIAYPNPMMSELYIESPSAGSMTITDLNGRQLIDLQLSEGMNTIYVEHLSSGTYFLSVQLANGKSYIDQFVKL